MKIVLLYVVKEEFNCSQLDLAEEVSLLRQQLLLLLASALVPLHLDCSNEVNALGIELVRRNLVV